jgi:hypothetical protein
VAREVERPAGSQGPGLDMRAVCEDRRANQDIFMRVMFDTIREQSVVLRSVAVKLGLRASGGPMWLSHPGEDPRYSSCVYEVPVLDWNGRRDWIKARGVSHATPSERRDMPKVRWRRSRKSPCLE